MKNSIDIESYCNLLEQGELQFVQNSQTKSVGVSKSSKIARIKFTVFCLIDFLLLHIKILFSNNQISLKNIVFVMPNLCRFDNNSCSVPILDLVKISNPQYINYGKEKYISSINNQKVYNLGGLIVIFQLFNKSSKSVTVNHYRIVNDSFLKKASNSTVFSLCYYDNNGLALAFSKYRKNFNLTELQHGSMINFYPYHTPARFSIVDTFFVRNNATIQYLKSHLAQNYLAEYQLIPYPKNKAVAQSDNHILYASSIETNGFHTVFLDFLRSSSVLNLNIIVRLHPREFQKKAIFEKELKELNVNYRFDISKNWLLDNTVQNLIVVSPWSSIIEEAADNGYKTIIIDEIGKRRYEYLIDCQNVFDGSTSSKFYSIISNI